MGFQPEPIIRELEAPSGYRREKIGRLWWIR